MAIREEYDINEIISSLFINPAEANGEWEKVKKFIENTLENLPYRNTGRLRDKIMSAKMIFYEKKAEEIIDYFVSKNNSGTVKVTTNRLMIEFRRRNIFLSRPQAGQAMKRIYQKHKDIIKRVGKGRYIIFAEKWRDRNGGNKQID